LVSFGNAFVVLAGREEAKVLSIEKGQDRHLPSGQKVFHHHGFPRFSQDVLFQEILAQAIGFFSGLGQKGPFARRQAVGFDHEGRSSLVQGPPGLCQGLTHGEGGGGNAMAPHEFFGEGLATFQPCSRCSRAENRKTLRPEKVRHSGNEGGLGAHHHQVGIYAAGEVDDGIAVVDVCRV